MQAQDLPRMHVLAAVVAVATAVLHAATASDSHGIFRDELYYLANAEHLGLGYVDHPPLIGWITWLARTLLGESLTALRLLPALAGGVTVWLVARTARELGGGPFAQGLAALMTALAPITISQFGYLSMNAFDMMLWAAAILILTHILRTRDPRGWIAFGIVAGVGLENKISVLFLGFGVAVGLVLTRDWQQLRNRQLWIGAAIAGALFLPHIAWQIANDWPTLTFIENASRYKNLPLSPGQFLLEQAIMMNPLAAPIALAGLWALLVSREGHRFRALGWCFLAILAVMIVQRAKAYYFAPAFPMVFAAGAWFTERVRSRAARIAVVGLLLLTGLALAPLAKPLLPIPQFVAYQTALGLTPSAGERHELGRLPQFFADRLGWRELAESVAEAHAKLTPQERERACVFGQNYGQAGSIDFYGPALGLPRAISGHNSYFLWGPRGCTGEVLLVIEEGDDRGRLDELFESVELGAEYRCADCMPYESHKKVWICRGLRLPVAELWPQVRNFS